MHQRKRWLIAALVVLLLVVIMPVAFFYLTISSSTPTQSELVLAADPVSTRMKPSKTLLLLTADALVLTTESSTNIYNYSEFEELVVPKLKSIPETIPFKVMPDVDDDRLKEVLMNTMARHQLRNYLVEK
jgi:hypothetical protein